MCRSQIRVQCLALLTATIAWMPSVWAAPDLLSKISCIVSAGIDTGQVLGMHDLPSGGVLMGAQNGLFLIRETGQKIEFLPTNLTAGSAEPLAESVSFMGSLPRGEAIIRNAQGKFFIARESGKDVRTSAVSGQSISGQVIEMSKISQDRVLIRTDGGLYFLDELTGTVGTDLFHEVKAGTVAATISLPNGGVLIGGESGLFVVRDAAGDLDIGPVDEKFTERIVDMRTIGREAIIIRSTTGLFSTRQVAGKITLEKLRGASADEVLALREAKGSWVGLETRGSPSGPSHLALARAADGTVLLASLSGLGYDLEASAKMEVMPDGGLLIQAPTGFAWAREVDGKVALSEVKAPDIGKLTTMRSLANAGVLIGTEKGLFIARHIAESVTVERVVGVLPGAVQEIADFPGNGRLIRTNQAVSLVREAGGQPRVTSWAATKLTTLGLVDGLPSGSAAIGTSGGAFVAVQSRLEDASVKIQAKENWEGNEIVQHPNPSLMEIRIDHECAPSAELLGLSVRIMAPGDEFPGKLTGVERIKFGQAAALIAISSVFDRAGEWSFQVVSTFGGVERMVGNTQTLRFVTRQFWDAWEQGWKVAAAVLGGAIVAANLMLFVLARRSAWAWRVATDDGWSTSLLRIAIMALSHLHWAQLWIIDLYFQRFRNRLREPRPFLPMPVTANDGRTMASTEALAAPWKEKRLWIQGGSGMGKTSVFRNFTEVHFRDHETAFSAFAKWGYIVVPFAARDFASSGEDKDDPAWVVDAVRATLSSEGLTFASAALLMRFLESGTIAVAIDGLNEVDRRSAVAAFSRTFSEAPIIVTSQQSGHERFFMWRLPTDIRAFTSDLIRLYVPEDDAKVIIDRLAISQLQDAIRSGYDVRLIVDLARNDPRNAYLPSDRMGLYAAVIEAGWPNVPDDARREQQSLLAAAAWRMVSERKPNEDMRRLRPHVDLPAHLLEALADAPSNDARPVRLIRRVGQSAFEFVHDQMHTYLAARWFAQVGLSAVELERMVASSAIWMQAPDARRTLWTFVSALLDDDGLITLWKRIKENDEWDILERALAVEGERRGILEPRKPKSRRAKAVV